MNKPKTSPATIALAVLGAGGRMGQAVLEEAEGEERVASMLAVFSPRTARSQEATKAAARWSKAHAREDAEAAMREAALSGGAAIDFTTGQASSEHAALAAEAGCPFVCGTTGLSEQEKSSLLKASERCAVVYAANFSLGVALLSALVERAARVLSAKDFDAEIFEMHHRAKRDAPSGTALRLGESVSRGRDEDTIRERRGERAGKRTTGEIGYGALRGGGIVGEHRVLFAGNNERITLGHEAFSRGLFASGAVKAALWACEQKNGFYSVEDMLNI